MIAIAFMIVGPLLSNGQDTRIYFEFGYNYNLFEHDYMNQVLDYSNTIIASDDPNRHLTAEYTMLENPRGFSMGMSTKSAGLVKAGIAFNWKRNESMQVRVETLYPDNISNSLHRVRMGNVQVHAALCMGQNSPISIGLSTELGRYSIKSIEYAGPTKEVKSDGNWDINHTSWHTWFSPYLNIELLAGGLYGLQIRPYYSFAVFSTDVDGWDRNVYTYYSNPPVTYTNNVIRPNHFGVAAYITIGMDAD